MMWTLIIIGLVILSWRFIAPAGEAAAEAPAAEASAPEPPAPPSGGGDGGQDEFSSPDA